MKKIQSAVVNRYTSTLHLLMQQLNMQATMETTDRMYRGTNTAGQDKQPSRSRLMASRISSMKMMNWSMELWSMAMKCCRFSFSLLWKGMWNGNGTEDTSQWRPSVCRGRTTMGNSSCSLQSLPTPSHLIPLSLSIITTTTTNT